MEEKFVALCVEKGVPEYETVTLQERRKLKCKRKRKTRTNLRDVTRVKHELTKGMQVPRFRWRAQCFHVKQTPLYCGLNQSFQKHFLE